MVLSYLGSKFGQLHVLKTLMEPYLNKQTVFAELFAGTGVISLSLQDSVRSVICNDIELYSYVLNYAQQKCAYTPRLQAILDSLNANPFKLKGLIHRHYATGRMFFTESNAMRIDYIRHQITFMYHIKHVTFKEFVFLLASLIHATSKVANTSGTYRAYLKTMQRNAINSLVLKPIHVNTLISNENLVFKRNAIELAKTMPFDVAYIDIPYNNSHYGALYSFLNYLCVYDKNIVPQGIGGIVQGYHKSNFGLVKTAFKEFKILVDALDCKVLFMSYNNDGVLKKNQIIEILKSKGKVTVYTFQNKRYKPKQACRSRVVDEFIFKVEFK